MVYQSKTAHPPNQTITPTTNTSTDGATEPYHTKITVHIAGFIANPGVYQVAEGTRVMDLLAIAGGPLPGADLDKLKLAYKLKDGQKVDLKPLPNTITNDQSKKNKAPIHAQFPININQANAEELEQIPGIGKQSALRIIAMRESQNGIKSINDIKKIKGLSPKKINQIKDYITF